MGWGNCGADSNGRPIGYAHQATCDHPDCNVTIDRGLAYACGGMHGTETLPASDWHPCEGYFCGDHRKGVEIEDQCLEVCHACYVDALEYQLEWLGDEHKRLTELATKLREEMNLGDVEADRMRDALNRIANGCRLPSDDFQKAMLKVSTEALGDAYKPFPMQINF